MIEKDISLRKLPEICLATQLHHSFDTVIVKAGRLYREREIARIALIDNGAVLTGEDALVDNVTIRGFGQIECFFADRPQEVLVNIRPPGDEVGFD